MTLVKTIKDIDITLAASGKFQAVIDGEMVTKSTLAQIEKAMQKLHQCSACHQGMYKVYRRKELGNTY